MEHKAKINKNSVLIRNVKEKDYPFILKINEENVEVLSPMNSKKLEKFAEFAELFLVVEVNGKLAAFLIALREGLTSYDSENYLWFSKNYSKFLYIDRIVIDKPYRNSGIGRKLYHEVFSHAYLSRVPFITAEIDMIPYNAASLKFHEAMGFKEVGVQTIRNNSVKVSLQEASYYPENPKKFDLSLKI